MSRIYEALKKAGLEQIGTETKELDPVLIEPKPKIENATVADRIDSFVTRATASAALPDSSLAFSDLHSGCVHSVWNPDIDLNVFSNPALAFGAEQFRTLRSRLYQYRSNLPLNTLLVTSSLAGEGKTFVAANLAQALVRQPNCRALLIDADLRRSRLHLMMGATGTPGLSDYLQGKANEQAIIQFGAKDNLCFIPGGTGVNNPSELLSNGRLKSLLKRIVPLFDWVIVDSPPYVPLSDASVLADLCDGVLLVAKAGSTPAQVAQRACEELQARKAVVGVVLNGADGASRSYELYEKGRVARDELPPGEPVPTGTGESGLPQRGGKSA